MKRILVLIALVLFTMLSWGQTADSSFYESGAIKEIRMFQDGQLHGQCVMFTEEGDTLAIANYKDGLKHGKWTVWRENGVLAYELFYEKGKKAGTWLSYNEKGDMIAKREY